MLLARVSVGFAPCDGVGLPEGLVLCGEDEVAGGVANLPGGAQVVADIVVDGPAGVTSATRPVRIDDVMLPADKLRTM